MKWNRYNAVNLIFLHRPNCHLAFTCIFMCCIFSRPATQESQSQNHRAVCSAPAMVWRPSYMMMMKFMFNVAAISWMMSDSRMGLVLVYNALGLMSNNVSLHVYTREVSLCTGSSIYICPNSLLYIYTGWSRSCSSVGLSFSVDLS